MGYDRHDIIERKLCDEIKLIEKKYETKAGDMEETDIKRLDLLYHALKSKATYDAMKDAEEYGYDHNQMSGRNMPRMSGHYPDPYYSGNDGYYPPRPRW